MSDKTTPLADRHVDLGAKMVPFGGWRMPLSYPMGTLDEHRACRDDSAVFDVSHLGAVRVTGTDAHERLQRAFTNDLDRIEPGRAQYTHLLDSDGSVLDDIIVWWVADGWYEVMPNASNTERVDEALGASGPSFSADNVTADRVVLAVQGPQARTRLATVSPAAAEVARFRVGEVDWNGAPCLVAGTGYTGEDGVEIAVPVDAAEALFNALLAAGVAPAGLGARDTLRLEAGLPLHGNELGPGISPLQAGLGWVVRWDKGDFRGRDALDDERQTGVSRLLRGLVVEGRRPPRSGQPVLLDGAEVGTVSSGNFSPVLERGIAMAFLPPTVPDGAAVQIQARRDLVEAEVVSLPFLS